MELIKDIFQRNIKPEYIKIYSCVKTNGQINKIYLKKCWYIHRIRKKIPWICWRNEVKILFFWPWICWRNEVKILFRDSPSIKEKEFLIFWQHCWTYLIGFSKNMIAKRGVNFLSPKIIVGKSETSLKCLEILLEAISDFCRIVSLDDDKIYNQFKEFISNK